MESDSILIKNIRMGDEKAFSHFFESFYPFLLRFGERYLNDEEASKDIVQDAFIYFWKKKGEIFSIPSAKLYLFKYVKHHSLNYLRDRKGMNTLTLSGLESELYYRDLVMEEELYQVIYKAMQSLAPQGQRVIELTLEGHGNNEIAEILGVSVNTVKTTKLRAFRGMRTELPGQMFILIVTGMI